MKRGVLIIALLLSLAMAADCPNEFTLYLNDTRELEGDTFELVGSGDTFSDIELEIDNGEVEFDSHYTVTDEWLVRIVSILPDGAMLRASKFFSESEGEEFEMNTCDKSAAEVRDKEILMMPSTYTRAIFIIDGEEIIIELPREKAYVGEDYLLELISRDTSTGEGITEAEVMLTKLRIYNAYEGTGFTLEWGDKAAVKFNGGLLRMLPENPTGAITYRGETIFVAGEDKPLDSDYQIRATSARPNANPPYVKLLITKQPEPTPTPTATPTPEPTATPTPTPEPGVSPEPAIPQVDEVTPTPEPVTPQNDEPTVTPEPTKSPATGLVTQERGIIGIIIDWILSLF
ncbi:MAG: hypothetical protein KAW41_02340 [Candidatus Diapherotrites archaeon]|nr:hypothetical protein [Candidatus Diapherotrites archaeon]